MSTGIISIFIPFFTLLILGLAQQGNNRPPISPPGTEIIYLDENGNVIGNKTLILPDEFQLNLGNINKPSDLHQELPERGSSSTTFDISSALPVEISEAKAPPSSTTVKNDKEKESRDPTEVPDRKEIGLDQKGEKLSDDKVESSGSSKSKTSDSVNKSEVFVSRRVVGGNAKDQIKSVGVKTTITTNFEVASSEIEDKNSFKFDQSLLPANFTSGNYKITFFDEPPKSFLPSGFSPKEDPSKRKSKSFTDLKLKPVSVDSSFLPPGYKPTEESEKSGKPVTKVVEADASLLPKGYSTESTPKPTTRVTPSTKRIANIDPSLLPAGYSLPPENPKVISEVETTIDPKLLPPGYKLLQPAIENKKKDIGSDAIDPSLLPPDYRPASTEGSVRTPKRIVNIDSSLLPKDYKIKNNDDDSKSNGNTPKRKVTETKIESIDPSLLPPNYKPQKPVEKAITKQIAEIDPSLLPPGFKVPSTPNSDSKSPVKNVESVKIDPSLLPPGYSSKQSEKEGSSSDGGITPKPKIAVKETVSIDPKLLPPGFSAKDKSKTESENEGGSEVAPDESAKDNSGTSNVLKTRAGSRWPLSRRRKISTARRYLLRTRNPHPTKKTPRPLRPTKSTRLSRWKPRSRPTTRFATRINIFKKFQTLPTRSPTTTSTTTEHVYTRKPAEETSLTSNLIKSSGVLKIEDGIEWTNSLADKNSKEFKTLALDLKVLLEEVFKNSVWAPVFIRVDIDGFYKGSVVCDFDVVFLRAIANRIKPVHLKKILMDTLNREDSQLGVYTVNKTAVIFDAFADLEESKGSKPKVKEDDSVLPQWAIAAIVISIVSLLFLVLFSCAAYCNRVFKKRKRQVDRFFDDGADIEKPPIGGYDNLGIDAIYDLEEWKKPMKQKNNSKGKKKKDTRYDSWKTEWSGYKVPSRPAISQF